MTRIAASGAGTMMAVCKWVGLLVGVAATSCLSASKSGGEIVDDAGTEADDDSNEADDGQTGPDGSDGANDTGETASCADASAAVCGDGRIDAIEECEGETNCNACASTEVPTRTVDVVVELVPFAVSTDGSSFGMGYGTPPDISLRRYEADGELRWGALPEFDVSVIDVAIDTSGDVYAVGGSEELVALDGTPWISALDDQGIERWSVTLPDIGYFITVALGTDRIAVGGVDAAEQEDNGAIARLQLYDTAGVEEWTVIDPSLLWIDDVTFVGAEVAATASGPGLPDQMEDSRLLRYDETGTQRWSVALPAAGQPGFGPFRVIADDTDGTWSFGQMAGGPHVVHHDRDGQELEAFGCLGGATGWVEHAALSPDNRLALGMEIAGQAWFAVLDDGVVTRAAVFGDPDSGTTAGPSAVQWLADGSLAAAWTEYPEEGGNGKSQLDVLSP